MIPGTSSRRERAEPDLQFVSTSIAPSVGAIPIARAVARPILVRVTESAAAPREKQKLPRDGEAALDEPLKGAGGPRSDVA
jgi:hypothetical protein